MRDLIRQINSLRKKSGLTINDTIDVLWQTKDDLVKEVFVKYMDELKQQVLAGKISEGKEVGIISEEVSIGKAKATITLIK